MSVHAAASLSTLRVLVVEDHEFQRAMLQQTLAALGIVTIHGATNGKQAMRVLRDPATPVDVVITDLMMPEVDGIELLPLLKQSACGVALVLSSADEASLMAAESIAQAHGLRVLGAIPKPITPARLQPLLQECIAPTPRP